MTTTVIFSGKEGKNSSKVLAPPGGKSSNIFGFTEESAPAPAPAQRKQQQASTAPFAQDTTPTRSQDTGPAKAFRPVQSHNPVTGEPYPSSYGQSTSSPQQQQNTPKAPQQQPQQHTPKQAPPQQQQQQQPSQQQASGGSGGEAVKTSVKIYNPPGGRSSITF